MRLARTEVVGCASPDQRAPRWRPCAALLALLVCSVALTVPAYAADPIVVQGTLTDRASGEPIANANVLTDPTGPAATTTDGNGSYFLAASQINSQGIGILFYQATGYFVATASYDVSVTPATLDATLLPGGAVIQGTVTDAGTFAGVAGADVSFRFACDNGRDGQCSLSPSGASAISGSGGQYFIDSSQLLEYGRTGLQLSSDAVSAATYAPHVDSNLTIPLADPLPLVRNFVLTPNHGITFQDFTARSGINFTGRSFGVSWGDFNGDGWADLYTGNHKTLGSLWINNGNGTFSNIFPSQWTNPSTPDKHGAAWGDFDNDGDQDIMELSGAGEGTGSSPNLLMVVNNGLVTNEAQQRGVELPLGRGRTPLWLDWNNDGILDLFMSNLSRPDGQAPTGLFMQSGGTFNPLTLAALPPKTNSLFAQSSELLGDGKRMLIIHSSDGYPGPIFAFGVSPAVNLRTALKMPSTLNVRDVAIEDFNGDLRPDFYLARLDSSASDSQLVDSRTLKSSFNANQNQRGVRFQCACDLSFTLGPSWEISPSKVYIGAAGAHPSATSFTVSATNATSYGMTAYSPGVSFGLYIGYDAPSATWSVMASKSSRMVVNVLIKSSADIAGLTQINLNPSILPLTDRLLLNTPAGFVDAPSQPALTAKTACESVVAGDFDNDMDMDLYLVCRGQVSNLPNLLFENDGNGVFRAVPLAGGAEGSTAGRGDSVAMADFDNDGFLDLFVTNGNGEVPFTDGPYQLIRNTTANGNHWLELQLRGVKSNRDGVGAKVIVTAGGKSQLREQNGGVHRLSQNFQRLHFGLAGNATATSVTVYWPSGTVQTLNDIATDQILQVSETSQ